MSHFLPKHVITRNGFYFIALSHFHIEIMFILSSSRKDSDHVLVHCILPDVHEREGGSTEATDETTLKKKLVWSSTESHTSKCLPLRYVVHVHQIDIIQFQIAILPPWHCRTWTFSTPLKSGQSEPSWGSSPSRRRSRPRLWSSWTPWSTEVEAKLLQE